MSSSRREEGSPPRKRPRSPSFRPRDGESSPPRRTRSSPPSQTTTSHHHHSRSDMPPPRSRRRDRSPSSPRSLGGSVPSSRDPSPEHRYEYGRQNDNGPPRDPGSQAQQPKVEKEKPNFKPSGKLAAEANKINGITLKFNEPQEARLPTKRWRLYVFKGEAQLEPYYIHRQSAYLIGRDRNVVDIGIDHPSCSKQHAVLQYRLVEKETEEGDILKFVKPYLMDLESTNGTFINGEKIEATRYYELKEKDVVKFGLSTREFVLLHEDSASAPE